MDEREDMVPEQDACTPHADGIDDDGDGQDVARAHGHKRMQIVLSACACIVLVVAAVYALFVRGAADDGSSQQTETIESEPADKDDGQVDSESEPEAVVDVTGDEAWILDFFVDLGEVYLLGITVTWHEVEQNDEWAFSVTDAATGEMAWFMWSADENDSVAVWDEETGTMKAWDGLDACSVWDSIDVYERYALDYYQGDIFEEAGDASADYTVEDSSGTSIGYVFNDYLVDAANAGAAVRGAKRDGEVVDPDLYFFGKNAYGYDEESMEEYSVTPEGTVIYKGELAVRFKGNTSEDRIDEIVTELSCEFQEGTDTYYFDGNYRLVDTPQSNGYIQIAVLVPEDADEWDVASQFETYDEVVGAYTQEVKHVTVNSSSVETDTSEVSGSIVAALPWQYYLSASGFEEAWESVTCEGSVTVGLIDSGIDYANCQLADNIDTERMAYVADGELVTGDAAGMEDSFAFEDDSGETLFSIHHGTHVAGVVSALAGDDSSEEEGNVDGASYNATILPVKYTDAYGSGSLADIADAYEYLFQLDDPPDVINLSNVASFSSVQAVCADEDAMELQSLINAAFEKGIVTVASAGNDGDEANAYSVPACLDNVVSVGSLSVPDGNSYALSDFSNTISNVDICAYGECIDTTDIDGTYTMEAGTSFSAPQVASAVALIMAAHPDWNASLVVEALLDSAEMMAGVDGSGCGALDASAAVTWEEGLDGDEGSSGQDVISYWVAPTSAVNIVRGAEGSPLTTYAVRDGALASEFLGISNTNFDFRAASISAGIAAFDSIADFDEDYLASVWGAGLAIFATSLNENPNPYCTNLYYSVVTGMYSTASAAGLLAATTWLSCPDSSSWGDSDGTQSYSTDGTLTIAGLEYEPDIIFGANKRVNWDLASDGSNSESIIFLYESDDDAYDPVYANNDSTNLWTQIYTLGQLATTADTLTGDSGKTTRYNGSNATTGAVAYEKAIRGQMLYIASLQDAGDVETKEVAYLYALDAEGTGYFLVPTASGLVEGGDTGTAFSDEISETYAANNAMVSYGYLATLPFVTTTFDSGHELEGGIVTREQDIYKTTPVCVVTSSDADMLADVDVIIFNSTVETSLEGVSAGSNITGVNNDYNGDALSVSEVTAWAELHGFEGGTVIAGCDYGDSSKQGMGDSAYRTQAGTAPLLVNMRDYTFDKGAWAAWAYAAVYPEAYGGNDDATYCYWVDEVYHVQTGNVSSVVEYLTNQSEAVSHDGNVSTFVEICAEVGYTWWVTTGSDDSTWRDYAYYNGSSRASYYSGDEGSEEPSNTIGIFAPSSLWVAYVGA